MQTRLTKSYDKELKEQAEKTEQEQCKRVGIRAQRCEIRKSNIKGAFKKKSPTVVERLEVSKVLIDEGYKTYQVIKYSGVSNATWYNHLNKKGEDKRSENRGRYCQVFFSTGSIIYYNKSVSSQACSNTILTQTT